MRSRWSHKRLPKDEDPFTFYDGDFDLCRLLSPGCRSPWGYQVLPTSYISALSGRAHGHVRKRIRALTDHNYYRKPDQPLTNFRDILYTNDVEAVRELNECGYAAKTTKLKLLPHNLLANMTAASFELGGTCKPILYENTDIIPDWHPFLFDGYTIFLEIDLDTEDQISSNERANTIENKVEAYFKLLLSRKYQNPRIIFLTVSEKRANNMISKVLKPVANKHDYDPKLAEHFCFGHVEYSRYLTKIIKPSTWVLDIKFQRAMLEPFSFRSSLALPTTSHTTP